MFDSLEAATITQLKSPTQKTITMESYFKVVDMTTIVIHHVRSK